MGSPRLTVDMQRPPGQGGGDVAMVASPIRLSDTPVTYRHAPPTKGSSTEDVLRDVLGKSADDVAVLKARGVL